MGDLKTLQDHLDAWYMSSVRRIGGTPVSVVDHFKNLIKDDAALKKEAEDKLAILRGINEDKCFISKTHKIFLEKVFA